MIGKMLLAVAMAWMAADLFFCLPPTINHVRDALNGPMGTISSTLNHEHH